MPIYEYTCMRCSERFSLLQSIHATGSSVKCPRCDATDIRKVISSFACASHDSSSSSVQSPGFGGGG